MLLVLPSTGGGFGRSRTCCGADRDWQSPRGLGRPSDLCCPMTAFISLCNDSCPPGTCCDTSSSLSSVCLPQSFEALYKVIVGQRAAPHNELTGAVSSPQPWAEGSHHWPSVRNFPGSAVSDLWVHQTVLQVHVVSSGDPLGAFPHCPRTHSSAVVILSWISTLAGHVACAGQPRAEP